MEDGRNAKSFAAAVGGRRMTVSTGGCTPAAYDSFAASAPIPTIGSATLTATVPSYLSSNQAQVRWIGRIPAGTPSGAVLVRVVGNGTLGWAEVRHGGPTTLQVEAFNDAGASVGAATWSLGQVEGRDLRFSFQLTQSGADIAVTLATYEVGSSLALFNSGTFSGVTLGSVPRVIVNPDQVALGDVAVGHLTFERTITTLFSTSAAVLAGHAGERADSRIARLCAENGVTFALFSATGAQLMGPQGRDDLLTLLRECEATDGGMLYEPRSTTHLAYRTGESLYSQTPAATVPYVDNLLLPFEPVEDDAGTRNRVTVTRDGGASATVEETTGPLGTATVGIYDEGVTLSLAADDDAERQAQWRVHLGTVDEARWPTIGYDLADPRMNAGLRDALLSAAGLGNRIDVTDLPPWLPPFDVSQIVEAYTERIAPLSYRIELACTPARPYRVPEWDRAGDRWSGDGTTTPALTATQTAFTVVPPAGVTWTSADGQYGILVGGELMTVTNVTGGTAFTVVRAVNGVSKSHLAGSAVTLADPVYYGL
jgi:hypothetical protein